MLLSHLSRRLKWAIAITICPASVRSFVCQSICLFFPLNDFFSRTTWPISTKLGGKHVLGMEIQICSNKGAGPFWGPIRGQIRKILITLKKSSSHERLIFGMELLWRKEIQVCSMKSLKLQMAMPSVDIVLYIKNL